MKQMLRKIMPEFLLNAYHFACAFFANIKYGFPSQQMFIVGVTGTKGKTSTSNYIWSVLNEGGLKSGLITTANFRIGNTEEINKLHMSMPNAFIIQKKLREMKDADVKVVVIEMTSEGMRQYRNGFIPVDVAVFTNLTPEHIASHGSFEAYKKAKTRLFTSIPKMARTINGLTIPRTIIANADSEHSGYYLNYSADKKYTFGLSGGNVIAKNITSNIRTTEFDIDGEKYTLGIPATFNIYNALPAIIILYRDEWK
jgi:UDP-N-acetylmuramoyl-L-alanyl-D-glutamate--2,6-diaminopimelate ligase